ncbi:hypothetical protein RHGRI_012783 [Rhododendron griersonianum]|uniref:Pectinesterase inhibitor domain-containing protein n=1 Tax=Rhododendron griersonianum TaxID=479676 RepID=A0AAV6KT70_9ERIC|nr:hypothetical protein RHGRI_012783 [Rhododendron griersonianum]
MARIPRTFFLLVLLLSSLSCSCVMGAFDLVDNVCIQNTSPPICREALRSDVRSAASDLTGLGYIAIDLTRRHVTATSNRIKVLIAQTQDPGLKKPLAFCGQKYREALFACERAGPSLGERYYDGFSAAGDAVSSLGRGRIISSSKTKQHYRKHTINPLINFKIVLATKAVNDTTELPKQRFKGGTSIHRLEVIPGDPNPQDAETTAMLEKPPRIGTETCAGDEQEQEGAAINDEQEK